MSKEFKKYQGFPIQRILYLRGMTIDFTEISEDGKSVIIHLNRDKRFKKSFCSECGKRAPRKRKKRRKIRDLPMLQKDVYLDCELFIVKCPNCGQRREQLDFVDKYSRMTTRFESFIFKIIAMTTVKDTANEYDLSWDTVKNIDKKYLTEKFFKIDYGNLEYVSIDEIANKKGHDYLTIVMNLDIGKVIWVGEGRKEENINEFFETLNKKEKERIRAVSIDMWPAFINSAKKNCPNADIVFDKFHIVKKFGDVINKLRNSEYQKAKDEKSKEILKGTKWLLLKNKRNLKSEKKKQLKELLELNENLSKVYILKEDLKHIWDYKSVAWAKKSLDRWIEMAEESEIRGIKSFIKMLRKHEAGILSHCQHPISNGKIEGTNNKIKTLKRKAYGFHDVEYFKLKILQTCQGKSGKV